VNTLVIRRRCLALLVVAAVALLAAACGPISAGGGDDDTPTPVPPTPTATPEPIDLTIFRNFAYPITGACLPQSDALMPNAPREYRSGTHEGVDLYEYDNCTEINYGDPALAAKDGVVVRADLYYRDLTDEELAEANELIAAGQAESFEVVDLFRGRQVWIDHGDGLVTRYAHLSGVAEGIEEGAQVVQGQTVAYVGDSGTPESLSNPRQETHLHWEVRVNDTYLGADLPPEEVRTLYTQLFEPFP
jgi:murein DD-endopeptidase MepM/ murein hydrolase activator NlpD